MAESEKTLPPATDAPRLEDDDLAWELLWHKHRSKILLGAVALVVAIAVGVTWAVSNAVAEESARKMLAEADDVAGWEAVIAKYPRSMPAADAYFRLAAALRAGGQMEESTAAFRKFLTVFPNHPLAGGALFGVGQNLDASGDVAGAVKAYEEVGTRYPGSYAAPFAAYSIAEIAMRDFDRAKARAILESIPVSHPGSSVARLAAAQLQSLDSAPPAP